MEGFQKTILFASIIILIVALVIIGIALSAAKSAQTWPPITADCPDYFKFNSLGKCVDVKDLGSCPAQNNDKHLTIDFNLPSFTGTDGACNKYNWAKACNVAWDGITYGVDNPCQTTS